MQDISGDERAVFGNVHHLQRFHPGLDFFEIDEFVDRKICTLPTKYFLTGWLRDASDNLTANRITSETDTSGDRVYVHCKTIHLLDPISYIKDDYIQPTHPLIPQSNSAWRNTLQKLHNPYNQAYVDTITSFVLSHFREKGLTPNCILAYGSVIGVSNNYRYRITDDFFHYRQCGWFWRGLRSHGCWIKGYREGQEIDESDEEWNILKEPDGLRSLKQSADEIETLEEIQIVADADATSSSDSGSLKSYNLEDTEENTDSKDEDEGDDEDEDDGDEEVSDNSTTSITSSEDMIEIDIHFPSMPVVLIYQEKQEGTMDSLMEEDEICGVGADTPRWNAMWLAWLFQIIAVLSFLQKTVCFTHNDLHTNNIVWRTTTDKFIYYQSTDGTTWKIPTYGKIFSIIDFGRAILRIGSNVIISDDHWPDGEAGMQYNFGPFYTPELPKVTPNPSFDLCRLAISLLDGLFMDYPNEKKGRNVPLLSVDRATNWTVKETENDLFNLLYSWTIDDDGTTLYETDTGSERYPGFDLYAHIARDVHCAVPHEQITRPVFDRFKMKARSKMPDGTSIYPLGF